MKLYRVLSFFSAITAFHYHATITPCVPAAGLQSSSSQAQKASAALRRNSLPLIFDDVKANSEQGAFSCAVRARRASISHDYRSAGYTATTGTIPVKKSPLHSATAARASGAISPLSLNENSPMIVSPVLMATAADSPQDTKQNAEQLRATTKKSLTQIHTNLSGVASCHQTIKDNATVFNAAELAIAKEIAEKTNLLQTQLAALVAMLKSSKKSPVMGATAASK